MKGYLVYILFLCILFLLVQNSIIMADDEHNAGGPQNPNAGGPPNPDPGGPPNPPRVGAL